MQLEQFSNIGAEKWERPWPSKNCAYSINLRTGEARFKREKLRITKEVNSMEKMYRQNLRKVNAAQRGVVSMLGLQPYPNCEKDHVLFEHNHPGFCYRRDGQPHRFFSLVESKTRKIVQDLDGKEGLLKTPAMNIISDSPLMTEILSSPEILEILCDLRTTSVLISDSELFSQFASTLVNSPNNPLPLRGDNPLECLMQYRRNLIQEFFDNLRMQMGIRQYSGISLGPNESDSLKSDDTDSVTSPISSHYPPSMSVKEWGEAVIERLREAKLEEDQLSEANKKTGKSKTSDPLSFFAITINQTDNLHPIPGRPGGEGSLSEGSGISLAPNNTVTQLTAAQTVADLSTTSPSLGSPIRKQNVWRRSSTRTNKPKRNEFDGFVKSLITEVENIAEVGKNMGQLQKKKQQHDIITNPLVRLLRKKSLFSSLNEDDLLFYEYDGGRRDAEHKIARDLNMNQPRPGGFTFRVPSRTDTVGTTAGDNSNNNNIESFRSRPLTAGTGGDIIIDSSSGHLSSPIMSSSLSTKSSFRPKCFVCSSTWGAPKSLKRLCCQACNAKLRESCNEARERDRRDKEQAEMTSWKTPGLSKGWTKNSQRDSKPHQLLSSIPLTLRKNYATYSTHKNYATETESPSAYGSPSNPSGSSLHTSHYKVPTPAGRRKNLLPAVNKLFSKKNSEASPQRAGPRPLFTNNRSSIRTSNRQSEQGIIEGKDQQQRPNVYQPEDKDGSSSWTLKVSRMDIMKLRHELESASVQEKLEHFENVYLDSIANRLIS